MECIPEGASPPGDGMCWVPGGSFRMGDDNGYPEEAPAHKVAVSGFWIDEYVVTKWLWSIRHDRQCLGMDHRLVFTGSRGAVLRAAQPAGRPSGFQL